MATKKSEDHQPTKTFTAMTPINHDGTSYVEGDEIELTEPQAKQLFELGAVVPKGRDLEDYKLDELGKPIVDEEGKPVMLTAAEKRARANEEKTRLQAEEQEDRDARTRGR